MTNALTIIRWEHLSIESVLHALGYFVDQMWAGKRPPENKVFGVMLQYLDLFAEHLHHPKQDRHLFRRLRLRTHRADELLDLLAADHRSSSIKMRRLEKAFHRYEEGGPAYFYAFAMAFRSYARFYRAHMRCVEEMLFPLAESVLTDDDWREIDSGFSGQGSNPISPQTGHDLGKLFDHILSITPTPIGAAPELAGPIRSFGRSG